MPNFLKNVYNKDAQVRFYPQVCAPIICRNRGSAIFAFFFYQFRARGILVCVNIEARCQFCV